VSREPTVQVREITIRLVQRFSLGVRFHPLLWSTFGLNWKTLAAHTPKAGRMAQNLQIGIVRVTQGHQPV